MNIKSFSSSFLNKFIYLRRSFGAKPFALLDVGAGNHSATKAKKVFTACEYHGIDMERDYNNSPEDFRLMKAFYELDLTKLDLSSIPDNYFDGIWLVHVLEHLYNGKDVLIQLLPKLKIGGYMYLEYPGKKSTKLPSMYGTLNFKDDPTHVSLYSFKDLGAFFKSNGCTVLRSGTRRNPWFIMAMPFRLAVNVFSKQKLQANVFWDVLGFAEFLWVTKN